MISAPVRIDSVESEPYRSLRTTLAYSRLPVGHRAVVFTSARRGEGKSTTAVNLAAVCAYGEQSALLIDADLRSPQIGRLFGFARPYGLVDALRAAGKVSLDDLVVPTGIPALDFVPAGTPATNAPELLSRPKLGELIEAARARYEWVVIDAPPVLPIADAAVISRLVDGVILVVDVRRTPIEAARRARDLLRAVDAPLLGMVANRSPARMTPYGYGRYPN